MTQTSSEQTAAVIGAGPAGLMAAEVLGEAGVRVTVYEQMPSVGRKFLLAGRGGLNLTHSEPIEAFVARYRGAVQVVAAVEAFPPRALRAWADALGQETFVGTSGRVFPKAMKASPLLRAWLRRLAATGVTFNLRHRWLGWRDGGLLFRAPDGETIVRPDLTILALGGASWPHLGSNGQWADALPEQGVAVSPLKPANCGFLVGWSETFRTRFEGQPLKGVALTFAGRTVRGEAIITSSGIEGGAVYAISADLRDAVLQNGAAELHVALRPDSTASELEARLAKPRGKQSISTFLRKALNLQPAAIGLLQEAAVLAGESLAALSNRELAARINHCPVRIAGVAPMARAISSAGGISLASVDDDFMLRQMPGTFVAGEMLDWEAPTGGYLLQACFATGMAAGKGAVKWLRR
ncbi:TIGR03862 family flavoprotein [Bradyrhizobium sp. LHD-71]|uniref:NAD(P)/FAD-dependent oxidoreductase n=1 Tax=Bradyrhizobium sp. LHD-71 TaxID=3072141 RepID=UPI00280E554B|nr:TIGR03862 family flavoprotein [Bradyrhizobium sp. LHD-71]MDQ8732740.1 TIGR03862 family flavoprotein [Bradyrhizobium sp. LHD-71]